MCVECRENSVRLVCALLSSTFCVYTQAASMKSSAHGAQQGFVLFTFGQQASVAMQMVNGIECVPTTVLPFGYVLCALYCSLFLCDSAEVTPIEHARAQHARAHHSLHPHVAALETGASCELKWLARTCMCDLA